MYVYERRSDKKDIGKTGRPSPAFRTGNREAIQLHRREGTRPPYEVERAGDKKTGQQTAQGTDAGELSVIQRLQSMDAAALSVIQRIQDEGIIQRIEPLLQTGANCGMFAMAMALADLVPGPPMLSMPRGGMIAKELEDYAVVHGLSAIGEAFSAVDLALAAKWYCMSNSVNDLKFVIAYFSTERELRRILRQSRAGHVYVLLPYLSGSSTDPDSVDPDTESEEIPSPEKMTNAHWSVIEESEERYRILEGHQEIFGGPEESYLTDERYTNLFTANQRLGDTMSWRSYIAESGEEEWLRFKNSPRLRRDIDAQLNETVRLNSQAIIVGRRSAVDHAVQNLLAIDSSFIYSKI